MKNLTITCFCLFLAHVLVAQELNVTYRCTRSIPFVEQLEEDKRKNPHAVQILNQMYQYADQVDAYSIDFSLVQSEQRSLFKRIPDGTDGVSTWNYETGDFSYFLVTKDDICYKKLADGALILLRNRNKIDYCVKDDWPDFCWSIEEATKRVAGYTCYRAVGTYQGRTITAWFTPEIPVSNGPLEYGGLPGLILELEVWDQPSIFKAVELKLSRSGANASVPAPPACDVQPVYTVDEMWAENLRIRTRNRLKMKLRNN